MRTGFPPVVVWKTRCLRIVPKFFVVFLGVPRNIVSVVPFAWYEIGQWGYDRCYDDERYLERELFRDREIEIFTLSRNYKELKERLELEKIDNMQCLPCEIDTDDFDDTVVDNKHLPYDVIDIVKEYDDRTKNTDGDKTKNTRVNGFYELLGRIIWCIILMIQGKI